MQRVVVRMRGQEHHGHVVLVANRFGRGDAVDLARESHVHQDQVADADAAPARLPPHRASPCRRPYSRDRPASRPGPERGRARPRRPECAHPAARPRRSTRRPHRSLRGRDLNSSCLPTTSRASSTASSTLFAVDSSPPFLIVSTASSTSSPACSSGPFFSHAARPSAAVAASAAAITLRFMRSSRRTTHTPAQTYRGSGSSPTKRPALLEPGDETIDEDEHAEAEVQAEQRHQHQQSPAGR